MASQTGVQARSALEPSVAAVLAGPYGTRYRFLPCKATQPGENEALVRIDYSGVCHGDVYGRDGGGPAPPTPKRPLVGGHEGIGEIMALGPTTDAPRFALSDRVGIAWRSKTCQLCDACHNGAENHCPLKQVNGLDRDGTFQRFVLCPTDELVHIPPGMSGAAACPILCAGVTAYVALRKMNPQSGKWCAISGAAGGLGHLAIQYAKKVFGLKVVAIDGGSSNKEAFCKAMGCDEYVDFVQEGDRLSETVVSRTGGGADYIIVLSPHQSAYTAAADYARFSGQIMAVGIGNCSVPLRPILQKDLTVRSTETGTKQDIEEALLLANNSTVTSRIEMMPLTDLDVALDRLRSGTVMGKLVLDLGRDHYFTPLRDATRL